MSNLFTGRNAVEPWIERSIVQCLYWNSRGIPKVENCVLGQLLGFEEDQDHIFLRISDGKHWVWALLSGQAKDENVFSSVVGARGCPLRIVNWAVSTKQQCIDQRRKDEEDLEQSGRTASQPETQLTRRPTDPLSGFNTQLVASNEAPSHDNSTRDSFCLYIQGSISVLGGYGMGTVENPGFIEDCSTAAKQCLLQYNYDWNQIREKLSQISTETQTSTPILGDTTQALLSPIVINGIFQEAARLKRAFNQIPQMPPEHTSQPASYTTMTTPPHSPQSPLAVIGQELTSSDDDDHDMGIDSMLISQPRDVTITKSPQVRTSSTFRDTGATHRPLQTQSAGLGEATETDDSPGVTNVQSQPDSLWVPFKAVNDGDITKQLEYTSPGIGRNIIASNEPRSAEQISSPILEETATQPSELAELIQTQPGGATEPVIDQAAPVATLDFSSGVSTKATTQNTKRKLSLLDEDYRWRNHPNSLIEKLIAEKEAQLELWSPPPMNDLVELGGKALLELVYANSVD